MRIQLTDVVARTNDMATATIGDDIVMLSLVSNNYLVLDKIGRRIWDLLATPIRVDALCEELKTEYSGSRKQIDEDVITLLIELEKDGAVQIVGRTRNCGIVLL